MTPEQLRAAAERAYNWYVTPNVEDAHRNMPDHVFYTGWQACKHILATVHPDDAEPVTVEKLKAMGAIVTASTIENPDTGFDDLTLLLNDDQDTVELRVYRESDLSIDIWINSTALVATIKTMGQLRHLLAGLGMGCAK